MAPKTRSITAKALQKLLARIGSASSGTKVTLQDRFLRDLEKSKLGHCHETWEYQRTAKWSQEIRVMSIDMGIKNLAFCDAQITYPIESKLNATMEVLRWEKIDLVKTSRKHRAHLPNTRLIKENTAEADDEVDPYSLSVLSSTAYDLVKHTILAGAPDIILIEKQRWRSGGGSAIQQWTVRVNTLEGMLWAALETILGERYNTPAKDQNQPPMKPYVVSAVDPKRVGQYWLQQDAQATEKVGEVADEEVDENGLSTEKKLTRSKAEKKAKINLLRSWLSSNPASTAPSSSTATPVITFKFNSSAEHVRQALRLPSKTVRGKKKPKSDNEGGGSVKATASEGAKDPDLKKLDDVTDCFLQAAAWVSWESNRVQLQEVRRKQRASDGTLPEVTEKIMLDMLDEVEKS